MSDEIDVASMVAEAEGGATTTAEETVAPVSQEAETTEAAPAEAVPQVFGLDTALPPELAARYPGVKNFGEFEKKYRNSSGEARRIASENAELKRQIETLRQTGQLSQAQQQPQQQGAAGTYFGFRDANEYEEALKKDPLGAAKKFEEYMVNRASEAYEKKIQERFAPLEQREKAMTFENNKKEAFDHYPEFAPGQPWHDQIAAYYEANPELGEALEKLNGTPGVNVPKLAGIIATYDMQRAQLAAAKGERLDKGRKAGAVGKPSVGAATTAKKDTVKDALRHSAAADGVDQHDADAFADRLERM